jgi:S1-C subfamily serine protease
MRVADRLRRAGAVAAMAVVIGGGGVAACAATAGAPAVSTNQPAAPAAQPAAPAAAPAVSGGAVTGYAATVRAVLPSVVLIRTAGGLGSGVVLDRAGHILTNAHVAGQATRFGVQTADDKTPRPARLVGSYPGGDLAVIKAANPAGLIPARFDDSSKASAGDVVLAVGNPLGLSGRAGLRAGDVIRKLGPAPITDSGTLLQELAAAHPGQQVEVTITRAGQERTVSVTLGTLPGT